MHSRLSGSLPKFAFLIQHAGLLTWEEKFIGLRNETYQRKMNSLTQAGRSTELSLATVLIPISTQSLYSEPHTDVCTIRSWSATNWAQRLLLPYYKKSHLAITLLSRQWFQRHCQTMRSTGLPMLSLTWWTSLQLRRQEANKLSDIILVENSVNIPLPAE